MTRGGYSLRRMRHAWFTLRTWGRRLVFWGGAVVVGLAAIGFAMAAEAAFEAFQRMWRFSPWLPYVVTPLGLAAIVAATRRWFYGAQGSGIPQTLAALRLEHGPGRRTLLSVRLAIAKVGLTVAGLLVGASVGREGPTVQVGAAIMHGLGRLARFPRHDLQRGLILAGGAAGVAAAFNTPLAGVVFAVEELSRSVEHRTSGIVLTAVVIAGVMSVAVLGSYAYFGHSTAAVVGRDGWIAVGACGLAGGLFGGLFSSAMIGFARGVPGRAGRLIRDHPIRFAALCGLVLALLGTLSAGTTYGTGYEEAKRILEGATDLPEGFGLLKMLATFVSYASGVPGGIFAPSLAAGAGIGVNLAAIMPYGTPTAIALLTMAAYFAGVVQAPITALVIVMEMTDNSEMVLPLMAAAMLGSSTSRLFCRRALYPALAANFVAQLAVPKPPPRRAAHSAQAARADQAPSGTPVEAGAAGAVEDKRGA